MSDDTELVAFEPGKPVEAIITVNGHKLTVAESMTVRVALTAYANDLRMNGLGDNEAIRDGYLRQISSITEKSYNYTNTHHGERM